MKEVREDIKPLIIKMCEELIEKGTSNVKKQFRELESSIVIFDQRLNERIDSEIQETAKLFEKQL